MTIISTSLHGTQMWALHKWKESILKTLKSEIWCWSS